MASTTPVPLATPLPAGYRTCISRQFMLYPLSSHRGGRVGDWNGVEVDGLESMPSTSTRRVRRFDILIVIKIIKISTLHYVGVSVTD